MTNIYANQMASPEGIEIFLKQKAKSKSKTILGEIWLDITDLGKLLRTSDQVFSCANMGATPMGISKT
jgi:hypothetical protein